MTNSEIIKNIRENLKTLFSTDVKFTDITLKDGKKITSTDTQIVEGSEVYALDANGNKTPLDNGDYILSDGSTITVTDNKVSTIKEAVDVVEDSQEEMADAPVVAQTPEEEAASDTEMSDRISALESQVTEILSLLQEIAGGQTAMKAIEKETPAEASIKKEFAKVNENKDMSEIEELRKLMNFSQSEEVENKIDAISDLRDLMKLNKTN